MGGLVGAGGRGGGGGMGPGNATSHWGSCCSSVAGSLGRG